MYKLIFYSTPSSNAIQDFINSTEKRTQAKILRSLDLVEKFGAGVGMPHVKKVLAGLFELRIRGNQEVRFLFTVKGKDIYFLSAFYKKSNKIPRNEIEKAQRRLTHT